jgi:hypothetical protein
MQWGAWQHVRLQGRDILKLHKTLQNVIVLLLLLGN